MKITSIKGSIGHTFGAAGALQIISALQSIQYGFIPPTLKTDKFGFEEMNIVTETIYQPVHSAAVTTHGVGGNNSCLLVSKYE
jgi:3-oxoacyl-[acyl-carrier-protein] synthase II